MQFFVEDVSEDFEMTFDPGPNKTSQYLAQRLKKMAPDNVKALWRINASLQPLSQKAIEASVQIKDQVYSLVDFMSSIQWIQAAKRSRPKCIVLDIP